MTLLSSVQQQSDYAALSVGDVLYAVLAVTLLLTCFAVPVVVAWVKANRVIRNAPRVFTDEDRRDAL